MDTGTPMGAMVFTVMAALAQMELEMQRKRITDPVTERRAAGKDLGGRKQQFTDSQIMNARRLIDGGKPGAGRPDLYVKGDAVPMDRGAPEVNDVGGDDEQAELVAASVDELRLRPDRRIVTFSETVA